MFVSFSYTHVLRLDSWERANYLKYQNQCSDCAAGFRHVVNRDQVAANHAAATD